ncbi:MAG: GGDEF domain-containing phosphodiesterase, partial [Butyricicoccus sp.]|nr:GGDEF domain-containing phosphodiesterase [Butyricicoccus sp.]
LKTTGEKTWVIGFGFNGMTAVNSTSGREYGDRLLKKISNALMENLSWKMSFYRLEGVRCIAIVHPACADEGPNSLVEQIQSIVKACYSSMEVLVKKPCSFGIIEYPNENMGPEDLVENLVSLIRVARQEPKLAYVDYSTQNIQRIKQMSNMVLALRQDVENNMVHFRIVIQPVVSAADGAAIGGEVLLRWTFEGKDISPALFIPLLEKDGLIQTVGRWVFEQAVCTCARLHAYRPTFYLTFNVSLHQLSDPLLLPFMKETLDKYRLHGSSLVAELTESSLDEQPEQLDYFAEECQKMGIYIALDDFGSGYSSLRMLLQYPSSIIKLDRSLVSEVTESEAKMNFIRSIVFACHQFGKTVCMEGVEHADQNEIIRNTGCDMIQGYYYYRPMEVRDLYQLVSEQKHSGIQNPIHHNVQQI